MFNNYQICLQNNRELTSFCELLDESNQERFSELVNYLESMINKQLFEKEQLLDSINNLQIQTQNKLDQEIKKNFELQKSIDQLNEQVQTQNTEIAFLNKSMKNIYVEQMDLFSPIKAPSASPRILRTQSINKQVRRKLLMSDKENEGGGNCCSSIKKIRQTDIFLDENEFLLFFKEHCLKEQLGQQMEKEQVLYKVWQKLQEQSLQKCNQMQESIDNLCYHLDQFKQKYQSDIQLCNDVIQDYEMRITKYKVAFQQIIQNQNPNQLQQLILIAKQLSESTSNNDPIEKLLDMLMDFNTTKELLHQNIQNNLQLKIQQLSTQINDLEKSKNEYEDIKLQRQELLELSQQMNDKIMQQSSQIEEMNQQIASLTQLFAKSLQDLEKIQEENESLRKTHNSATVRTQEGSVSLKNHFIANRYSTYLPRETTSCKNSYRVDQRVTNFSSDFKKQKQISETEDICQLIDQILNKGFDLTSLEFINNFQCISGNFKVQLMWQKLKDLLLCTYYTQNQIDGIFESLNDFIIQMKIPINQFNLINDQGLIYTQDKAENNQVLICQLLHRFISDIHDLKSSQSFIQESSKKCENQKDYSQHIISELTNLSQTLIQICQSNDEIIVQQIEKQLEIQKELKIQKNKKLRDIQTSTCKMLMDMFKEWKQNYLHISQILLILCKGWQQLQSSKYSKALQNMKTNILEEMIALKQSDLGQLISQELKIFSIIYKKYFNQIAYGDSQAPLQDPNRVLGNANLVFKVSNFLDDTDLLCFIQINSKIYKISQECCELKIRILQIRLQRQTQILDYYIQDPEFIYNKSSLNLGMLPYCFIPQEQKKLIKLQDILIKKKNHQQKLQQQQQIQEPQLQQKQIIKPEIVNELKQFNNNVIISPKEAKKIELEKLINEVYSLLNEESPKPKSQIKINDITKNLCPIIQYQRIKSLINNMQDKLQPKVKYI